MRRTRQIAYNPNRRTLKCSDWSYRHLPLDVELGIDPIQTLMSVVSYACVLDLHLKDDLVRRV
jgi:hypothetical protein